MWKLFAACLDPNLTFILCLDLILFDCLIVCLNSWRSCNAIPKLFPNVPNPSSVDGILHSKHHRLPSAKTCYAVEHSSGIYITIKTGFVLHSNCEEYASASFSWHLNQRLIIILSFFALKSRPKSSAALCIICIHWSIWTWQVTNFSWALSRLPGSMLLLKPWTSNVS